MLQSNMLMLVVMLVMVHLVMDAPQTMFYGPSSGSPQVKLPYSPVAAPYAVHYGQPILGGAPIRMLPGIPAGALRTLPYGAPVPAISRLHDGTVHSGIPYMVLPHGAPGGVFHGSPPDAPVTRVHGVADNNIRMGVPSEVLTAQPDGTSLGTFRTVYLGDTESRQDVQYTSRQDVACNVQFCSLGVEPVCDNTGNVHLNQCFYDKARCQNQDIQPLHCALAVLIGLGIDVDELVNNLTTAAIIEVVIPAIQELLPDIVASILIPIITTWISTLPSDVADLMPANFTDSLIQSLNNATNLTVGASAAATSTTTLLRIPL